MVGLSLQYPGFHQQAISHLHRLLLCTPPSPPQNIILSKRKAHHSPRSKKIHIIIDSPRFHLLISFFHCASHQVQRTSLMQACLLFFSTKCGFLDGNVQ
ncbi:hypothetical protein Pst134EB_033395 [Puccinia striiformis f. sp. tritici]|nr:hypothetical protein Pst134EB_033395 [Puccinia striiformis f. sp. tritici]